MYLPKRHISKDMSIVYSHQNPLLLPTVSENGGNGYVRLKRDLASLIPKVCGETVSSIVRHKSSLSRQPDNPK
jgi:hypothetical protein